MRDLIISAAIVLLLLVVWMGFDGYSNNTIEDITDKIEDALIPAVEAESWQESISIMEDVSKDWKKYRNKALLFLDSSEINEIDSAVARSEKYIIAEDVSNSSGELWAMADRMRFLTEREKITIENIL